MFYIFIKLFFSRTFRLLFKEANIIKEKLSKDLQIYREEMLPIGISLLKEYARSTNLKTNNEEIQLAIHLTFFKK